MAMDSLTQDEGVEVDKLLAHGGMFQTEGVAQQLLAGSLNVPVSISNTASEGGAWGVAVLAAYAASGKREAGQNLQERSEEHTSELQSRGHLVCRLLREKKK